MGEAQNATEARKAIDDLEPDLLFLDVQMPGESATDRATAPLSPHDRVFVMEGERSWLVELGLIRLFESEGNYTRLFFGKEKPLINRSLNQLEARLDGRVFFRANRSQIINLKAVRGIHPWFGGRLMAELEGGQEVTLSRRRARAFRDLMSV